MRNQTLRNLFAGIAIFSAIALSGCNKDDKPKPKEFSDADILHNRKAFPTLKVTGEMNEDLAQAQILIGSADGEFAGNYGQTNEQGEFPVPANWTTTNMVTIDAPGYLRATYMGLEPGAHTFKLKKKLTANVQLGGITSGHPVRNKDGFIDFSLVMSGMTRQDLLNFQIQKIVSPVSDKISIVGQEMKIPANISLPKQTENYLIGITIDKPAYRLFFTDKGVQRVFAARGRFPFKTVVDALRDKKEVFELINYFSITGGSIRDVNLTENKNNLNIPVMDLTFSEKKSFKAPKLASSQVMVALTVSDNGGYLIPTDVKRLTSEQSINLAVWNEHPVMLAQVIKNKDEFDSSKPGVDRLSAILLPFDANVTSDYLPLIASPSAKSRSLFIIPTVTSGINKLTTYGLLSDLKINSSAGGITKKTPTAVWEVYAPGWVSEIKLPNWSTGTPASASRFEVSLVGSASSATIPVDALQMMDVMEKATHVTRSSVDF